MPVRPASRCAICSTPSFVASRTNTSAPSVTPAARFCQSPTLGSMTTIWWVAGCPGEPVRGSALAAPNVPAVTDVAASVAPPTSVKAVPVREAGAGELSCPLTSNSICDTGSVKSSRSVRVPTPTEGNPLGALVESPSSEGLTGFDSVANGSSCASVSSKVTAPFSTLID